MKLKKIKNIKPMEKINETKGCFQEKIYKTDKPQTFLEKEKKT